MPTLGSYLTDTRTQIEALARHVRRIAPSADEIADRGGSFVEQAGGPSGAIEVRWALAGDDPRARVASVALALEVPGCLLELEGGPAGRLAGLRVLVDAPGI